MKSISIGDNIIELGDPDELICRRFSMNKINYVSVPEIEKGEKFMLKLDIQIHQQKLKFMMFKIIY